INPAAPVTQSFADVKGAYYGLFAETNGVRLGTCGFVTISSTTNGSFTLKVTVGTNTWTTSPAKFDASGMATVVVPRFPLVPIVARLQLDLNGGNQVRGTISSGKWVSSLLAYRKTALPGATGSYTLNIPGDAPIFGRPAGDGFAAVALDATGKVGYSGAVG